MVTNNINIFHFTLLLYYLHFYYLHILLFQAAGTGAAGVETHHPIRARTPRKQVLRDGGDHGNSKTTPPASAGNVHTGELVQESPSPQSRITNM